MPEIYDETGITYGGSSVPYAGIHVRLTIDGTLFQGCLEQDIVAGGRTIVAEVVGDTWHADIGGNTTATSDLIAGITGDDAGASGWDDEISITYTDVTRSMDGSTVTIELPASASYSVSTSETLTFEASGSTLTTTTSARVANEHPVIVEDSLALGRAETQMIQQSARHMVWVPTGPYMRGYRFFVDGDGDVAFRRTNDGGENWQAPVKLTSNGDAVALDLYYERWADPSAFHIIHLMWGDATDGAFYYARFVPADSTTFTGEFLGPIETVADGLTVQGGTTNIGAACTLVSPSWSSGVYAIYHGTKDGNKGRAYRVSQSDWRSAGFADPHTDDLDMMILWPDGTAAGPSLQLIFWDTDADEIRHKVYDAVAGSWGADDTISGSMVANIGELLQWATAYQIRSGRLLLVAWEDAAGASEHTLKFWELTGTDEPKALTAVVTTTWAAGCAMTVDQSSGDTYVAFAQSASGTYDEMDIVYRIYSRRDGWLPAASTTPTSLSGSVDADVGLLVVDPGSANDGRWLPAWWDATTAGFAVEASVSLATNGYRTASIAGTAMPGVSDGDVISGGKTLLLTLEGDSWVATGSPFNAVRQDIISGIKASISGVAPYVAPVNGWNNEVLTELGPDDLVRTSDTVVTVTLPAVSGYSVAKSETIEVEIPPSALVLSERSLVPLERLLVVPDGTPTIDVLNPLAQALTVIADTPARGGIAKDLDHGGATRGTPARLNLSSTGAIVRGYVEAIAETCNDASAGGREAKIRLESLEDGEWIDLEEYVWYLHVDPLHVQVGNILYSGATIGELGPAHPLDYPNGAGCCGSTNHAAEAEPLRQRQYEYHEANSPATCSCHSHLHFEGVNAESIAGVGSLDPADCALRFVP